MDGRLILGIDNSLDSLNLFVAGDRGILEERSGKNIRAPSEILPSLVSGIISDSGYGIKDITNIIVTLGPGSFTGIRVSLAFCKGLRSALGIPVTGVPTLDALSFPLSFLDGYFLLPLVDAKKGEVFCTLYRATQGRLDRLTGYRAVKPADIAAMVRTPCICFGTGVQACSGVLADMEDIMVIGDRFRGISCEALFKTGYPALTAPLQDEINLIYGRQSEAEIKFNVKLT